MPKNGSHAEAQPSFKFRFTPAEWRMVLEDDDFFEQPDNSYFPRLWLGIPVEIVPAHTGAGFGLG